MRRIIPRFPRADLIMRWTAAMMLLASVVEHDAAHGDLLALTGGVLFVWAEVRRLRSQLAGDMVRMQLDMLMHTLRLHHLAMSALSRGDD